MNPDIDPIVGNWYRHLDKGQMFMVVAIDIDESLIELQHFDGDIEEVDLNYWRSMDVEVAEAPEDCTGPMDGVQHDDLGYSETATSGQDWASPLQETRSAQTEAWEDSTPEEDSNESEDAKPIEEPWVS